MRQAASDFIENSSMAGLPLPPSAVTTWKTVLDENLRNVFNQFGPPLLLLIIPSSILN